ncbi:hypothetical protein A7U60_g773 [Sanghuangporus baumii]|uniref:Protein kinase domain-containing protein n=1 Tax=Sanghuangporus baumii TaxID=108892 RepID=A0A9Q5I5A6_SANBA|nr:hypothetical protein A7U60_g773 [Sanghuangporus baumii]
MPFRRPDAFKVDKETDGTYVSFSYPKLPYNIDFETYRKTDPQWKKIVEWHNRRGEELPVGLFGSDLPCKERFIFAGWPRDPDGPTMAATPQGKVTGNGSPLWGATLYDFYRFHRHPKYLGLETISTGSKLAAWMKDIGELGAAPGQLKQAEMEDEPYELQVFDIGQYIEVLEEQVWKGRVGKTMQINRADSKVGTQLLYAPSEYPAPWPLRPFSAPLARFQRKLPHSSLPRKLIVHDPWNVLCVSEYECFEPKKNYKWGMKADIVRTYHLESAEDAHSEQGSRQDGERDISTQDCSVAHLYITPRRRIGRGHHSFVYQVELELPRNMLVQPKVCYECTKEVQRVVKSFSERNPQEEECFAVQAKNVSHNELSKNIPTIRPTDDLTMQRNYSQLFKEGRPFVESDREDPLFELMKYAYRQDRPPFCEHLERGIPAPPSQRVSVIAKLSLPDDEDADIRGHVQHLRREAENYQRFPSHMFEHWNGYNVLQPMHDPTPVGAVVPQFYGFYVPDKDSEPIKNGEYMSPILLLEHCGVQVNPTELSMNDRQECFSLIRRLHIAGYVHKSVYRRNFVMQYGPLQYSPFKRSKLHPRFRLIDFGRSFKYQESRALKEVSTEVEECKENLRLGFG